MESGLYVLAVNPGSTSTKVSLFCDECEVGSYEIEKRHQSGLTGAALDAEVQGYVDEVARFLPKFPGVTLSAVVGRGGFLNRRGTHIEGGVYAVAVRENDKVCVCDDIVRGVMVDPEMDHASNLGIPIAARLAVKYQVPAFCVDPVVSDDYIPEARYSGYASVERKSIGHALSVKRLALKAADRLGRPLVGTRMVVVHMGGGITVAAVRDGKMIDNNNALLGSGPFTPSRCGSLPMRQLMDLCFSGRFTQRELEVELTKGAGLRSYVDEDSGLVLKKRLAAGEDKVREALSAMAYQIAKEVGGMAVATGHPLDALVFSGGLVWFEAFFAMVTSRVEHLAPVILSYPDSVEMEAMATGALSVVRGCETMKRYRLPPPHTPATP